MTDHFNERIVPAIIPESVAHLKETLHTLSFLHEVQIDVVDGRFVPFSSWPYEPAGEPKEVSAYLDPFSIEIDLMVNDPVHAALAWQAAGAELMVFHVESISAKELSLLAEQLTCSIGISINNDTPLVTLEAYAELADYFQLMGIRTIGAQGQPFDEAVLTRIYEVKSIYPDRTISIDGSVNLDTIGRLEEAGADRFVSGSAILKADSPEAGFAALCDLLHR